MLWEIRSLGRHCVGCGLLGSAGCGEARRIAATSEIEDGTVGLLRGIIRSKEVHRGCFFFFYTMEALFQVMSDRGLRTC